MLGGLSNERYFVLNDFLSWLRFDLGAVFHLEKLSSGHLLFPAAR
jgi:hypothetical protein